MRVDANAMNGNLYNGIPHPAQADGQEHGSFPVDGHWDIPTKRPKCHRQTESARIMTIGTDCVRSCSLLFRGHFPLYRFILLLLLFFSSFWCHIWAVFCDSCLKCLSKVLLETEIFQGVMFDTIHLYMFNKTFL